jgi:4-carboxymuconolactone decarboxylase
VTESSDRRATGLAKYREVYGPDAATFEPGHADFFDVMMQQLFGEIWSRPGLSIENRRLVVMGVLAAQYKFDTLGLQFARALATGELSAVEVRELVIHLIAYVGYPSSGDLYRVAETAIAEQRGTP